MMMQGNGGISMKAVCREVETFIEKMDKLQKFDDEVFISFYEKVDELQDRLDAMEEAGKLSHEEKEEYSKKLSEAFGRMKGKMSFCTL